MQIGFLAVIFLVPAIAYGQTAPWPTHAWAVAAPDSQGLDEERLEQLSSFIEANSPTRYSLLVVRNGYLVFERYYHGSHAGQPNNIKSISKSVLSVLTGIAIDEGRISGAGQRLHEFFPEYFHPELDARKFDITLDHLLTMTAGLEWAENTAVSDRLFRSSNWFRTMIEFPMVDPPGAVFNYNTGLTHLMSGILTKVSGTDTREYATSRIFAPLGITCYGWSQDRMGYYFGGSEVWLTPRDLAKFGLLVARKGRWDDRQLAPAAWIEDSMRLRIRTGSRLGDYAYWWWKYTLGGYPVTLASGYGGQNIFIVPDLDLVVVTTARSDQPPAEQTEAMYAQPYEFMAQHILPAVVGPPPAIGEGGVVNAADYGPRLAAGSFASVFGTGLALLETHWDSAMPADGLLPAGVGGVRVRIGGRDAHPTWVGPLQVNFLIPSDLPAGTHRLHVITARGTASSDVEIHERAPAWFVTLRDRRPLACPRPVRPGEIVDLYASGLGPTEPAAAPGTVIRSPLRLAALPAVRVGGQPAHVEYGGLVYAGVYQLNVRLPAALPRGDVALSLDGATREAVLEIR